MASGEVSAARIRISEVPRLRVLVAVRHRRLVFGRSKSFQEEHTFVGTFLQLAIMTSLLDQV